MEIASAFGVRIAVKSHLNTSCCRPGDAGGAAIRAIQNHLSICWQLKIITASSINKSAKEHVPLDGWVSSAPPPFLLGLLIAAATALSAGFATE